MNPILETNYPAPLCGVDEVGRGPWAGPVIAAAVIAPDGLPEGIRDSKKLSLKRREALFDAISERCLIGIGRAEVEEIDAINILAASMRAMERAIAALGTTPAFALIDGNRLPVLPCPGEAVVKGDDRSPLIGAASIIAKVTRDREMVALAQQFPGYGWERNAGYGVKAHSEALKSLGVTPHHRRSFKPIHNILCEGKSLSD
ncbi:ribonuclease HII [Paracoccaceae bacterium GXU_MW_L88]